MEDEQTQTSSPGGGWQGRLSAFLHVHRGSRASSRKSSRASDASDLSELGGPWLNLPLLLLSSAANMAPEELDLARESADVSIMVSGATPQATTPTTPSLPAHPRRRSIYNFFLRHQDAVETPDDSASPPSFKKGFKPIATPQALQAETPAEPKPKRGSLIRRNLDRIGSCKVRTTSAAVPINQRAESEPPNGTDVSILVTEPSPDSPSSRPSLHRQQSEATVVQVLVHRESEEYHQDEDVPDQEPHNEEIDQNRELEHCIIDVECDDDDDDNDKRWDS